MAQSFKRKKLNLKVEREFQLWLLVRILGVIILCSAVAGGILFFYARHETASSFYQAHIKIRRVSDLLLPVVLAGSLVSLVSGAILAIFLPQKIAGPIYRIEKDLEPFQSEGDLTVSIHLRRGDTLQDFARNLNAALSGMRERVQAVKDGHQVLIDLNVEHPDSRFSDAISRQEEALARIKT